MNRFLMSLVPLSLIAATASPVQLQSTAKVERHVTVAGHDQIELATPSKVLPGDALVFETNYRNGGGQPATRFVITNPLPAPVAWTGEGSAGVQASIDGGRSFGSLAELRVTGTDGKPRPAKAAEVTHLRWTVPVIAPGAAGSVRYRGVVR